MFSSSCFFLVVVCFCLLLIFVWLVGFLVVGFVCLLLFLLFCFCFVFTGGGEVRGGGGAVIKALSSYVDYLIQIKFHVGS